MPVQSSRACGGDDEVDEIVKEICFEHCAEIFAEEMSNSENEHNSLFLFD
jgi:hypothetical protein